VLKTTVLNNVTNKNVHNKVNRALLFKEQFNYLKTTHSYHVGDPSPWPFLAATGGFMLTLGTALYMHRHSGGWALASTGFLTIIYCI
jgi:hypothetical protein